MLELRDYQIAALKAIEEGTGRQLVVLPTGAGKTVVFSELLRRRGGTALILAHRDELLKQAAGKLAFVAPELGLNVGFVQPKAADLFMQAIAGQRLARFDHPTTEAAA